MTCGGHICIYNCHKQSIMGFRKIFRRIAYVNRISSPLVPQKFVYKTEQLTLKSTYLARTFWTLSTVCDCCVPRDEKLMKHTVVHTVFVEIRVAVHRVEINNNVCRKSSNVLSNCSKFDFNLKKNSAQFWFFFVLIRMRFRESIASVLALRDYRT